MPLFHGSNVDQITLLDPQKGVFDPSPYMGIFPDGVKVHRAVVWLTNDFEVAVAFAMKGVVDDLIVDAANHVLYLKGGRPISEDDVGYVYTVEDTDSCVAVNAVEFFSERPLKPVHCQAVGLSDFRRYRLEWGLNFLLMNINQT